MTVLVSSVEAAKILDITTQAVARMRATKRLVPVRSAPFRFLLTDVETIKAARAGKRFGRPRHGVEFVHTGGDK